MNGKLPKGWAAASLKDLCSVITDGTHQTPNYVSNGVPFLSTANLRPFFAGFDFVEYRRFISFEDHLALTKRCAPEKGDILISKCGTIGRVKEVDIDRPFSIFVGLALLKPLSGAFFPKFSEFWLNSPEVANQFENLAPGSTRRTLTLKGIKSVSIPVPPFNEQRRIVERLGKLLEKIGLCRERLEKIPTILKRFRQSVLAAACSGSLTADWRAINQMTAPEDGEAEAAYIPDSWKWLTISNLALPTKGAIQSGPFGSSLLHSEFQPTGILVIGIDNVLDGAFSMGKQHRISETKFEALKKFAAKPLDVLVTVMATVGRCCVVPKDIETAIITKHVYRISCNQKIIEPRYLMHCFRGSSAVREQIIEAIRGVTRPGINGQILKSLVIPLPPLPEQHEIVRRVEELFALADKIETRYKKAKEQVDKLTQSILAKAFRGELVPQDPNDEPASELLKRIAAAREPARPHRKRMRK